ncbi:hypothetical protein SAMN05216302_100156 [Nitrosomonas aestuarii]|uniref:Novel STAND NTPase 1 domain-containing protein n=1 Tax=Nitrosomonas aestuarii TaxID=52441 RepID=A0A1I3X0E0_9PROT|nr:hypothetical protein [Nitrosomonas aestuarii]SFK13040.1 hypothetical protein SAMN05216302_100156 [Nitrosomonas aestuarii]
MTDTPAIARIDAEHPWPWLDAFPEYAATFFNGRDEDSAALLRCVFAAPVTVLFGKSGLGKSSLLQAGLFPRLRKERLLPVYVRLNHGDHAAGVSEQITRQFHAQLKASLPQAYAGLTQHMQNTASESLWMQLHHTEFELRDDAGRRWTPVFVLDQFEEIFTLGAADLERQQQLFYELGDLMENRIPRVLAERLHDDTDGSLYEQLNLDTQHYRFLLSLREDYLPDLAEWTDRIPRLGANRYRLLPMIDAQAVDAVIKTGGKLVTPSDAQNIVHYLTHTQTDSKSVPIMQTHQRRQRARVEPVLLSLICSGLNAERLADKKPRLNTDNLVKEGSLIVERFYDTEFTGLPESVRDFIE